ncbi:MAG: DUF3772 domain-containing protein [Paracoccaceae bacterium]
MGFWTAAVLALGLLVAPASWAQSPAAADATKPGQPTIKVHADSSGALIPEVQRAPETADTADDEGVVSGGGAPLGGGKPATSTVKPGGGSSGALDYAGWGRMADRAETAIADTSTTDGGLEMLRGQLVDWRGTLQTAQNANSARISTLGEQIAALGPAPAAGVTEAAEIASRRTTLSEQLTRLQAPGIAADEAYQRADGLIREIDRVLRERQANELLKLWPNPLNPANWPAALGVLTKTGTTFWTESSTKWHNALVQQRFVGNLLVILPLLLFGFAMLARGWRWADMLVARLQGPSTARGRRIFGALASLGLILLPVAGCAALAEALQLTGLLGPVGLSIANNLTIMGLLVFSSVWLGTRVFPAGETVSPLLVLPPERRVEGRFLTTSFGILLAIAQLRQVATAQQDIPDSGLSVLNFPIILVGGLLLLRMGRLLNHAARAAPNADEARNNYRQRLISVLARITIAIGVAGPVLAAIGYISAGGALVFPTSATLGLLAILYLVQELVADFYSLVTRSDPTNQDALAPVLIGFVLAVAMVPVFALIWGARVSDLTELWTRFQEGFQLGNARISPTDFLFFAIVFFIGYSLTRLLQGALKNSILPRTGLDHGGQNAVVSGLGYVGILVSALVAINSTGIDLSGLAIVAGALSVGIGFGLQTVVSNFVSGIILLIERPISEGDWIEVGPVQGIVTSISVRSTRIQTFDRSDVIVPNSDLISQRVTNWTRFSLTGRLIVAVNVPFTMDSRKVERILREIAEAQPLTLLSPPPIIALMAFGPEVMSFEIRVILRDVNFSVDVRSEINHQIAKRFAEEGLVFSNAHRDYLKKASDDAAAEIEALQEEKLNIEAVAALLDKPPAPAKPRKPPVAVRPEDEANSG